MTSRARSMSPRRSQLPNSLKKHEIDTGITLHPGRHPLRPIPEASQKSSSTSEQTEPGSPSRAPTPRGKKRGAAVYRQNENVDGNIGSASNTPEKPREKRTTLTRPFSKITSPWPSKLPVTASLARAMQESLQQTDADSVGGTSTTNNRTPAISNSEASKIESTDQTPRAFRITGKPPLDSETSKTWVSSSNSSFLQSTPSRASVNRSLRYGGTPGSAASTVNTRAPGSGRSSGSFQFHTGQQILAQQFDFEEDPTFWEDHNVQVILRTRPISTSESAVKGFSRCIRQENPHSITWIGQPESRFTFDHVAGEYITQERLFRVAGVPMVDNSMAGYNSCMFCYGQTGSGKTYTMLGDIVDLEHRPSDNRGITPRVFEYLFSRIQREEEARTNEHLKYVCKCSFLEIFNEQITDLLEPTSTNLQMREGGKKGVYVDNLSEVEVGSVQDVVHLLLLGAANRKVAATNMNRESSRSHSVFTCTIESKWESNSMTNIRFGRLNLVDLAGSERQKNSGAEGERLKEAANINKSLSTLGLVIMILVDVANGKQRHVPYRDSKLTYLLQDSLGGNSKTTMIANISPSSCCALETLSTLKFAQRAKFIRNNAVVNEDGSGDVNGLRQEIQELKEELDRMRMQGLPRTPSMHSIASIHEHSVHKGDTNPGMAVVTVDEQEQSRCSLDSWEFSKAFASPRFPHKKLEAMEAVLAGALRREQEAELSQKRQGAEIEQLTRLVKQREDDSQCSKMLLRFREEKIRRLESLSAGITPADTYLMQENVSLLNELQLIQAKVDRNPELTRFAMENIRLLEQLRRFQDFYTGGEREAMADEISNLRDQLLEVLDSKLSLRTLTSPQREALAPELAAAKREIELLQIEVDNYRREVEDCRKNLSSSLEANSRLTKQLDESSAELRKVKLECQVHQKELHKLRDQVLNIEAEWCHVQHSELTSNLMMKLQQTEDRSERESSMRPELHEELNAPFRKAADFQAELQETRRALNAAEMLASRLQSGESSLSVAQEMAAVAQDAVRQIHLETKEIAEDQRLSLQHIEDTAFAARMKESELLEEPESHFLIAKLSSTKEELKCFSSAVASLSEEEQAQEILDKTRDVSIIELEQDLKSLELLSESTHQNTISVGSAREELDIFRSENSITRGEKPLYLEHINSCMLKLNFDQEEGQRADDLSQLKMELETTIKEVEAAQSLGAELPGDRDLQVLQTIDPNPIDLENMRAICSLQKMNIKLEPHIDVIAEQRKKAVLEGISDDSLTQPTAVDRVREQEPMNVQHVDVATSPVVKTKDTDHARLAGGIKRNFAVCTTMLRWFSETLALECAAKNMLRIQNERTEEELRNKDCLISSLQTELERATVCLFEKSLLVSELQDEHNGYQARLLEAEAQVASAVNVQATLLEDIEKHRVELATVLKRMEDTELELAQMQDVLTREQVELIGCERKRERLAVEKEQLVVAFSYYREVIGRSSTVATIMVWWLQNKIAADEYFQKLNYDDLVFQLSERDRMVVSQQDEITRKTLLLEEHMGHKEILINQNSKHMQEIDNAWKEIAMKDALLGVMQTDVLRLQDELLASEDRSFQLTMEKKKLHKQLSESAEFSKALEGKVSKVQSDLQEAEAKVVELAIVQTGMFVVQGEWELDKERLERDTTEAKKRCTQLKQELELACNVAQKFQSELEEAKTEATVLREERDKVVTYLQEELNRTQVSADAFKDQFEHSQGTVAELDSRLQKYLKDWDMKKETTFSAAMIAQDQCLEKNQVVLSIQASFGTLLSQLFETYSRETQLSHELEEVLELKEKIQIENERLRSKTEELVFAMNQQGQEIYRQEHDLELKLQKADDKVENMYGQMKAILVDLDSIILTKKKLEEETECIEHKILHHCSNIEQELAKAHEDRNQIEDLSTERESTLLRKVNTLQSENVAFCVRIQALEVDLEGSKVLIQQKEEKMASLRREWTESESKAVQTQEKLDSLTLLLEELAHSQEQWRIQKEALAAENKRLTSCMACQEMEFSTLQDQKASLEKSLQEVYEKEGLIKIELRNFQEKLTVLEQQSQDEIEQLNARLVTVNRELVDSQELKQGYYNALNELEQKLVATEKNFEVTLNELETQWNIEKEEMENRLSKVSLDFVEVKNCAEKIQLDLANTRSLLSAADSAIKKLLYKRSVMEDSYTQLLAEHELLRLQLSHWEQYATELQESSFIAPSPRNESRSIADSEARPSNDYFDIVKREVERTSRECETLRAQVLDKDDTILSIQMELSAAIASSRQVEIELECAVDERSDLKLQLKNINRALTNAQDEVRCRELQLEQFETELHKIMDVLVKTEEKMDESELGWRKQIEGAKAEMEVARLCAIEKGSEVTMLRRQFEEAQSTLQEAEHLVNALVLANDSAKRDVHKWKSREEEVTLQSSEVLGVIEEEVSVTMYHVEKHMQVLGLEIHGMRMLLKDSCLETTASFNHELKECFGIQNSDIERATEGALLKLAKINAKVMDSEQRLHQSVMGNEALKITLNSAEDLLRVSQAALGDAVQNVEAQHKGWAATRDELQGALASLLEKDTRISEFTSECDLLFAKITELERLLTERCEELTINVSKLKELEMEKLTLVEATEMQQVANNHLHGRIQQIEMSLAEEMNTKQVMEMEISSLRQQLGCFENQIHKFEADLAASHVALKVAAAKLLETESTIRALNTDLDISRDEMVCVQGSLENAVTELNDLGQHAHELELKEVHLMAQAATQRHVLKSTADKLVQVEVESDATMGILASILECTSSELRDKETVIADMKRLLEENDIKFSTTLAPLRVAVSQMRQEKEFLFEKASVLADDKKDLVERLELQSKQLCKQFQETSAASTAHEFQLEILKTVIESVSNELQEKDLMTSALREKLEESSAHALDILASLQTAMLASAQIEHERDELLETANKLEMDKRVFKEEVEKQSRKCSDLELQILRLQNELQDVSTLSHKQKLDLEILTTMLESAVKESKEKDAMATDLENLLSQSQLQNAEMLQSSQEVVNHFSLFQSQLDACFQQNKELERNKLVLTAEVHSQSKEMDKLKAQLKTAENSLDEMRNSFGQLNERKDQEVRGLSIEFELLKSQVAVMEADLWDWEQRCQDTEVQLDEKDSELDILRGKLLATQEECKEQVELMYDELRGCQHHIAEMESERRDLINEIEEASATVAKIQEKLQTMENEMEEHFTRHCIEQEELDSLQNEKRELQVSVKHLISEVAATQQRAAAAENMHVETKLEMEALERDLKQKDDLLQSLEYDLNVLQESALQELHLKQELDSLRVTKDALQQELNMQKERRTRLEMEIGQGTEEIVQFRNQAATWKGKAYELETELDKKRQIIESLEDELRMAEENMANTLEEVTVDLKEVENDRDRLQMEALELTEKLEMTQAMVEERDVIASELHQAAERSNTQAKEKEDEVKLLTRSVEELDSTIYALESQLGSLKREAERQRLLREDTEMKLQKLNNHIFVMESALNESNTLNADELKDALSALKEVERKVQEKESEIAHLQRKLENLEILSKDKDVQITDAMAQISDLLLAAEVQKADFQQKLKRMEIAVDQSKTGNREVLPVCTTPNSIEVATELDSSSANLTQEALSQSDLHVSCGCRIKELEDLASSRQKELFVLNTRLAEAESMTHDVLRDLVGVKTDMNNYASMLGHQQIQELAETARRKKLEVEEMEAELSSLRLQITNYIEERKSGIEEVNLRQCEMVAAHVATETLRQKEQMLSNEIGLLKIENTNHQERIRELETEIRRFPAGQHSFQEQINHHAKIKEENQALKLANEELSKELRRTELLYAGMHDEVARYRAADQRSTSPSFDEDLQNLRRLLQEAEDSRILAAQNLSVLCSAIMQAAGLSSSENVNSSSAIDALQLLESRLQTAEQVISDKYKMKSTGERRKRTNIRAKDSPLRSISNFTDLLHRASSPSSAPR